jgi:hypothetical protein
LRYKIFIFYIEGDRKAYYETSQWAIRRNKEEMNTLRGKNKELRDAISRIKKVKGFIKKLKLKNM